MATSRDPHDQAGEPAERNRNGAGGSDQTVGADDAERARAFENIRRAAQFFGVDMQETDWRQLGRRPRARRTSEDRQESARKAASTRKRNERGRPET